MRKDHPAPRVDIEQRPSDPVLSQTRPYFVKSTPNGLQTGIPIGQPNSTVLMSTPICFRSSIGLSDFSHVRTGSPPAPVRKKITSILFRGKDWIGRLMFHLLHGTIYGTPIRLADSTRP